MKNTIILLFLFLNGIAFSNDIKMINEQNQLLAEDFLRNENVIVINERMHFSNDLIIPEYITLEFTEMVV